MYSLIIAAVFLAPLIPLLLAIAFPKSYGMSDDDTRAPHQPPAWVFPVVWTGLFAIIGGIASLAFVYKKWSTMLSGVLLYSLLIAWPLVFNRVSKRAATVMFAPILMASLGFTMMCLKLGPDYAAISSLVFSWCVYALTMSVSILHSEGTI